MAKEIERKFLVKPKWKSLIESRNGVLCSTDKMKQGYICMESGRTVRVRVIDRMNGKQIIERIAKVTIKGPSKGISRDEYEYSIPYKDANEMLKKLCIGDIISKTRYSYCIDDGNDVVWEIDVFSGKNKGLVVAEAELKSATQKLIIPDWISKEVTVQKKYGNGNLSKLPFSRWAKK